MTAIAVLNTKGGVGKTTTALNLAIGRALQGRDVLAVDGDRQGSLIAALANRGERLPAVAAVHYPDGQALRQQVLLATKRYQDIVIDCAGGAATSSAARAALMLADLVVVPFQPRSIDVWALDDTAALLDEARAVRDIRAVAFLAMADARGQDNAQAAAAVPAGIEYLHTPVGRRKAIAEAAGMGMSILELSWRDEKANAELHALVNAVFANS